MFLGVPPKTCTTPTCENHILDKEISTIPDVIRCSKCHSQLYLNEFAFIKNAVAIRRKESLLE
ncbi:hypothetical protein EHO58_05410 [Leptospira selangorensis]|nr:hypothetical protein EHO58_05410 [Leptospira selangorensis]